jgi:hypothetical protein
VGLPRVAGLIVQIGRYINIPPLTLST